MKACLIRPPIVVPRYNQNALFTPALGLAYIAGALREAGHEVTAIDALGESLDTRYPAANDCYLYGLQIAEIVERIADDTEIIGIGAGFTFEWPTCRDLSFAIKQRFPGAMIIAGGEHITAMPDESLRESEIDLAVLGEGEETAVEILNSLNAGTFEPSLIAGIANKTADGSIEHSPIRARMRDVDQIPLPAWDLMPIEEYLDRNLGFGVDLGRSMPMLASRGCPYQCTFCSSPQMWTTRWLARDQDLLLDELESYQQKYGATNFDFYDLTAIVKKSWIVQFCNRISARGLSFTWQLPSGTRSEAIDSEVAPLLYQSGCRNLSYAPESGSPTVLQRIKKKVVPDRMLTSMRSSVASGINIKCNIMLGFPGETYQEVRQTFGFITRMALAGAHDLSIWAFSPYPGSELFKDLRSENKIVLDDKFYDALRSYADTSRTRSYSEHISDRMLKFLRVVGLVLFYGISWLRRPLRPVQMIINVVRGTHESRAEMVVASALRRLHMPTGNAKVDP